MRRAAKMSCARNFLITTGTGTYVRRYSRIYVSRQLKLTEYDTVVDHVTLVITQRSVERPSTPSTKS